MKIALWLVVINHLSSLKDKKLATLALGLLTTVWGLTGLLAPSRADELPEQPNPTRGDEVAESNQTGDEKSEALPSNVLLSSTASLMELQAATPQLDSASLSAPKNLDTALKNSDSLTLPTIPVEQGVAQTEISVEQGTEDSGIVGEVIKPHSPNPLMSKEESAELPFAVEKEVNPQIAQIPNNQQPTTNNQQPTTNNQQLTTNNQQPTTNNQIEISPVGDPRVPADGRSLITLKGRITNDKGELITEDTVVTLTTSSGKFVGADYDKDLLGFQVLARRGEFTAQLQSSVDAQKVRIRAAVETTRQEAGKNPIPAPQTLSSNPTILEAYTQVEFVTHLRPSIVSGSVNLRIGRAGTNFWGRRRDFLNPEFGDGAQVDLTGAVFATGRLGEWSFTGAYNSERNLNENCDGITRLFRGPQFCEQQYPVYGDSSTVDYLTPSTDSVYLRFQRTSPVLGAEPDYVMWGDYNTQEFARNSQVFTATTRQLHGFKGNYNLGNLQFTALYSRDIQGFQRDTIPPNGTSGYYFLSRRLLIAGSENVFLETEEINRPGTVIERKPLSRGADYEIDYDRGSLMFRSPVLATEFQPFSRATNTGEVSEGGTTLVRRIVVTYQYENAGGDDASVYAGRLQYNFSHDFITPTWLGATYFKQDQGIQDFELYGADFLVSLGKNGQIIGEYAHSFSDSPFLGGITGSAYRLEVNSKIATGINARAYYRSVEENFTNDATLSFTPGQTRYGAAATAQLGSTTLFQVGYDHEVNFGTAPLVRTDLFDLFNPGVVAPPGSAVNNSLTTIRAGVQQKIGTATVGVDYVNRDREDRASNVFTGNASQIVSRADIPLTPSLLFRAQNELNLSGGDPLYPNRTTFGVDWGAYPGVTLRLAHQFFDGGLFAHNSITSLDTILERKLGENTAVTGRYSVISAFNGVTGQGAVGLKHRWIVSPGLRVNLGYEHTFSNSSIPTAAGVRFNQPYTVSQTAAALALLGGDVYSVGVEYTDNPNFQASARFEHRTGSGNDNTVWSAAAAGKLSPSLTALARYEQANFANQGIEGLGDTATLRLGLAYRDPSNDKWNGLLRYEFRQNPYSIPDTLLLGSSTSSVEHVFAAEAIYAPSWRWEFYGKGALRHSTSYLANNFSNDSTIFLSQLRATYRLGYRMDLAVEGRWIGQRSPSYDEFGIAVETGYYLTPDLRVGVGYSFGSVDDRDFTGYRSKDGPYLSLTLKVNELLGGFGRQRVVPRQQQESDSKAVASLRASAKPVASLLPRGDAKGERESVKPLAATTSAQNPAELWAQLIAPFLK